MSDKEVTVSRHSTFGSESEEDRKGRERWPSRIAFYLAAVGSAVGFGNVWRFPALAKDYGGGAFFIPYAMALFLIGLPTLILEISLGQVYQTGNVGAFGSFHRRFRGVGVTSIICAFVLVSYYSVLLAWVSNAFFDSFTDSAPWDTPGTTGGEAVGYFYNNIIGMDTVDSNNRPTRLVGANVGYAAMVWFCVFLCLAFGSEWTGRIAYITMGLPILFLFLFFFKAITLTGASDGIEEYIGKWEMDVLTDQPDVWSTAVSQIFFSLSVTMGTMTAYGSHCPRGEPAVMNSVIIGFSNCMFSFISGFAVFASMGHLAHLQGIPVDSVPYAGFSLVFGTWPVVFGTLSGGIHWVRLLFLNLFLLGIDSAFSILEAPIVVVCDWLKTSGNETSKTVVSAIFCFAAFIASIIYASDAGLFFLDAVDFYINFILLLVGFLETFGAGWVYGIEKQMQTFGPTIVFGYMFSVFGSVVLACCIWFGVEKKEVIIGFVALIVSYLGGTGAIVMMLQSKVAAEPDRWTLSSIVYELMLKNVIDFKDELSETCGYVPWIWAFGMKHFIPQVLLILFINLATSKNSVDEPLFGNYGNYVAWPFQVLGVGCVVIAFLVFIIGLVFPDVYKGADLYHYDQEQKALQAAEEKNDKIETTADAEGVEVDKSEKA